MNMENIATKVFLFRHTQTVNTMNGIFRYNGFIDVDVDEHGLKLLKRFIPFISKYKISAIYSSDLLRAKKGAEIFANYFNIKIIENKNLREVKQGRWEGLSYNEIIAQFPEEAEKKFNDYVNYRVKGGENLVEASNRVNSFINDVVKKHRGENIIILAHGGINTLIILKALNMGLDDFFKIKQDFGCLNEIDYFENFTKVIRLNMVPF
jgi:alpha-ribazole phosphatase